MNSLVIVNNLQITKIMDCGLISEIENFTYPLLKLLYNLVVKRQINRSFNLDGLIGVADKFIELGIEIYIKVRQINFLISE